MSPTLIGIIGILIMLAVFMTRMPVAYVMALVGYVGFSIMISGKAGLTLLSRNIYETFSSYGLTTIPLFILMGQLAFNSGIGRRLYDTAYKFIGSTRGGLAMATVTACTAFGAVCGSSPATAATMGTVGLPEMRRYGYADELASGSVASGGGLGMIMPPSVVLIVYGLLTEQSIGALFVAGILPAIVMTILFILCILIQCRFMPEQGPPGQTYTWAAWAIPSWCLFWSWVACFSEFSRPPRRPPSGLSECWRCLSSAGSSRGKASSNPFMKP